MMIYPEIAALESLKRQHTISIKPLREFLGGRLDFPKILLELGTKSFELFVDDEHGDLKLPSPCLHLCIVLRALENYAEADDYLVWCTSHGLNAADPLIRQYHMGLGTTFNAIEKCIGEIDSYISDFDFELNAGAAQALREVRKGLE